ncbi:hypothetical protein V9T40_003746 [Parthenolecanium corni]|uniref:Protein kinase domain-containing protein n=1 Tax=Parthenolecanium corni TaxID=536013 RepID=A0AAN9TU48_9HEMI
MTSDIHDLDNSTYTRGNYVGKGAFSKSYLLIKDDRTYCGKFIPKGKNQVDKQVSSVQEFRILSKLKHKNIVNFVQCIETPSTYCLITEYYPNKSMFELIQRRGKLTIYEVRFFSKQLLSALKYLHDSNVVHRDVKPQNMLLDENLNLKLSDFGMAVICTKSRTIYKRHIYGTPNYISPEMITKTISRYNYKVDIWAVGCFLYHTYTGRTPFRGKDEKILYTNIQNCSYHIPSDMPQDLVSLVQRIFQRDPERRPDARLILNDDFFKNGFTPNSLPITAMVERPKFIVPTKECKSVVQKTMETTKYCENKCFRRNLKHYESYISQLITKSSAKTENKSSKMESKSSKFHSELEYPMLDPFVWVVRVEKQNKNVGYVLNDGTKGVLFDDKTILALLPNQRNLYFVTADKQIKFYTISRHSSSLNEKMATLKTIFDVTIDETQPQSISDNKDWLPMLPYLLSFYETTKYYILLLSNGLYQVISKMDDMKLLLCMKTSGFSVINKDESLKTYDLNSLNEVQYPLYLQRNLEIACSSLRRVLTKNECFACKKEIEVR